MAELIDDGSLVRALVNLEARTPRLAAAVERADEAFVALALEAAEAATEDDRRGIRAKETKLAQERETSKAVLAGHLTAVEAAKARLEAARQAAAGAAEAEERKRFEARAQMLARAALEEAYNLDERLDVLTTTYKRLLEKVSAFYQHFGGSMDPTERNELAFGMTAYAVLERLKLRATIQGMPLAKTVLDLTATPLPPSGGPLMLSPAVSALLDLHKSDARDGRLSKKD